DPVGGGMEPEQRWMAAIADGDEAAFERLVARHGSAVLNTIRRFVGDTGRAEELAQEVFLRLWRAAPRYQPTAAFRTWLFTIVKRLCWNELRRSGREVSIDEELGEGSPGEVAARLAVGDPLPEERLLATERARAVRAAIGELPPAQRMAVICRRYEELSYEEIAQALDTTVPAVKSLLVRARRTLAQRLAPWVEGA
ncbi:MAG: sigma-70 family RNA polymerase sigma factor, partial [bacterium]